MSHALRGKAVSPALIEALFLTVVFILCRVTYIYILGGLPFNTDAVYYYMQTLDPKWLKDDLWGSLFYLHSQPPLNNFLIGMAFKLAGRDFDLVLEVINLVAALAALVFLNQSLMLLGIRRIFRMGICVWECVFPTFFIYSMNSYTTNLEYSFCCFVLYRLVKLFKVRELTFRDGLLLFLCCSVLEFLRSQWHPVFFICLFALIIWFRRNDGDNRRFLWGTAAGLSPVLLLFIKNLIVFGFFGASSWMGMNLAEITSKMLPPAELDMLQQRGDVSLFFPVLFKSDKADKVRTDMEKNGAYVVNLQHESLVRTKINGYTNFNYLPFIEGSQQDLKDSLAIISYAPMEYVKNIYERMLDTSKRPSLFYDYREYIIGNAKDLVSVGCQFIYVFCPALTLLLTLCPFGYLARNRPLILTSMFLTISMAITASAFTFGGESDRMRWGTEPFYLMFFAMLLEAAARSLNIGEKIRKLVGCVKRDSKGTGENISVLLIYLASYFFYKLGLDISFDAGPISYYMQYLDPKLLQHDLLDSLWYLHSQPPLMNLIVGLALKIGNGNAHLLLAILFFIAGYVALIFLNRALIIIGIRRSLRLGVCIWICIFPTFILYANWAYTPHFEFTLCCALLYYLSRMLKSGAMTFTYGLTVFLPCTILGFLRPQWSLEFFIAMLFMILMIWRASSGKERFISGSAVALSPLVLLYLKNLIVFGFFGASSWGGMNLAEATFDLLPPDELEVLQKNGDVSPFFPVVFSINKAQKVRQTWKQNGRSVIDIKHEALEKKKSNGNENDNYLAFIESSQQDLSDSLAIIMYAPMVYVERVYTRMENVAQLPTSLCRIVPEGMYKLQPMLSGYKELLSWGTVIFYTASPALALLLALQKKGYMPQNRQLISTGTFIIIYIAVSSSAFTYGDESERMRWGAVPFYMAFFAMLLESIMQKFSRKLY